MTDLLPRLRVQGLGDLGLSAGASTPYPSSTFTTASLGSSTVLGVPDLTQCIQQISEEFLVNFPFFRKAAEDNGYTLMPVDNCSHYHVFKKSIKDELEEEFF